MQYTEKVKQRGTQFSDESVVENLIFDVFLQFY